MMYSRKNKLSILLILIILFLYPHASHSSNLNYEIILNGDGSSRPHVKLKITNINSDTLTLVVNKPLVDDYGNLNFNLIKMIGNISAKAPDSSLLSITYSQNTINSNEWYWFLPIYYDVILIENLKHNEIYIEYDIASNSEIFSGLGANSSAFWLTTKPNDFWHGYLEFILFRPSNHNDVSSANLKFVLPVNWDFQVAALGSYPEYDQINLGTLDNMYGDNIRWKNYQRSPLVIYDKSKFNSKEKNINGIRVIDVYSNDFEKTRNQAAFFQYFEYLCSAIGTLPINVHLTFYPAVSSNEVPYIRAYQAGPYGFSHGLLGEFYGAGGDIGLGEGKSLAQVQLWDFNGFGDDTHYSFAMHGTVRPWVFQFLQCTFDFLPWFKGGFCTYYENMAVAQKYGLSQVITRRFKPMYQFYVNNIAGPPEIDQKNFSNHSFQQYFKSALVAYHINELLKKNSAGAMTINDFMRLLFNNYASQGVVIDQQIFINSLNSLTNYDFTDLVNNYMTGSERLYLDSYFQ